MTQLRWGAAQQRDQLFADLDAAIQAAQESRKERKFNPDLVDILQGEIIDLLEKAKRRYREEIEPMLQRQAPAIERRLEALEQRLEALEQGTSPIPFTRRKEQL